MKRPVESPSPRLWSGLLQLALEEDLGPGDVTTALVVAPDRLGEAAGKLQLDADRRHQ